MAATLPPPPDLERTCKGLATLDALMSEDWEFRYYSFNAAWAKGERMASMRNGSGDDWFLVFCSAGVFLKSFWHEHRSTPAAKIYAGIPAGLSAFIEEPAFSMEDVTFGGWHDGTKWTLRGDDAPMAEELAMLQGAAKTYRAFAKEYYERSLPIEAIEHVLQGKKLDAKLLARLESERTLGELKSDLAEIGYGGG